MRTFPTRAPGIGAIAADLPPDDTLFLRRMLADRVQNRGHTIKHIANTTRISRNRLLQIARDSGLHYRCKLPTQAQVDQALSGVLREGLSCKGAALKAGMSKSAVHRLVQAARNRHIDSAGPVRYFQRTWRCPDHGLVGLVPCVACLAMGNPGLPEEF
ncbi:hypothetical protein [Aureliella helgolandensis]|uniref:Uncharacterized protein n=1 Tax=Aureliella helgolandensis TaxID=2527968 RepID=A0A518G2V8_9BACT|nr:hypothetical protein [Aureliella helgolandensis]QDV22928.1 hypothetical protein Q31a_12210 [Aureliella helgolandensis]